MTLGLIQVCVCWLLALVGTCLSDLCGASSSLCAVRAHSSGTSGTLTGWLLRFLEQEARWQHNRLLACSVPSHISSSDSQTLGTCLIG